jgi:multidrug efflux system outer membrane protein
LPVFDPRTWQTAKVSEVDQKIALAQYEKTIQTSFHDVANVLAVRGTVDDQVAAQQSLVESVSQTHKLSQARYLKGVDSYLGVLDAQRSLYTSQQQLVTLRLAKLINQVQLYAALGGGWQEAQKTTTSTSPEPQP